MTTRPPHMAQRLAARIRRLRDPGDGVIPGSWWGAVASGKRLQPNDALRAVVLHHTAWPAASLRTLRAEAEYMRALEHEHLLRGWSAIGYHRVVMPSGRVFAGRPMDAMGAHARGHNRGTLGISLAGNFESEQPTPLALRALDRLLEEIRPPEILLHGDLGDTACPGRNLRLARSARPQVEALSS